MPSVSPNVSTHLSRSGSVPTNMNNLAGKRAGAGKLISAGRGSHMTSSQSAQNLQVSNEPIIPSRVNEDESASESVSHTGLSTGLLDLKLAASTTVDMPVPEEGTDLGHPMDDDDDEPLSQASHIFQVSARFDLQDSSPDPTEAVSESFKLTTPTSSTGFTTSHPETNAGSSMDVDTKAERDQSPTQGFDSQTYHSAESTLPLNTNQNSNVKMNHSTSSSSAANSTLSHNTSTTQSSSTPTRTRTLSPVLPTEFNSPFASQKRRCGTTTEMASASPRQGLPSLPASPAKIKRKKQENRTYTIKKIGDLLHNLYNFIETRSFENRTLHYPRESQQYREKGGKLLFY